MGTGLLLLEGRGVKQEAARGRRWMRRGAAVGDADCAINLGVCYAEGVGGPQDDAHAASLFLQAAQSPVSVLARAPALLGAGR